MNTRNSAILVVCLSGMGGSLARAEDGSPATAATATSTESAQQKSPESIQFDLGKQVLARRQSMLSALWVFASLNYLYCDVVGLMDSKVLAQYATGTVNGLGMTEGFLLGATILMQVPMSMVFLSTVLEPKAARIVNVAAGALMTVVQAATLFAYKPTSYYLASSIVEIATTGFITIYSLLFLKAPEVQPVVEVRPGSVAMSVRVNL